MNNISGRSETQLGMSLLEVSLVILLMAIFMGISIPRLNNFFETPLTKEAKRLAGIISKLRTDAIINGDNFKIIFEPKKSQYRVLVEKNALTQEYISFSKFSEPILMDKSVGFYSIKRDVEEDQGSKFGFKTLEFEQIFGQDFEVHIDSSGLVDLFTVKFKDNKNTISLSVVTIMGKLSISKIKPL